VRFGYSWPLGHGRRAWVSMGPIGWLLIAPLWACVMAVVLAVWLLVMLAEGIVWLVRAVRASGQDRR
jgi:hypothetical protein